MWKSVQERSPSPIEAQIFLFTPPDQNGKSGAAFVDRHYGRARSNWPTPSACSAFDIVCNPFSAPRFLNQAVSCMFSKLKNRSQLAIVERVWRRIRGISVTAHAICHWAIRCHKALENYTVQIHVARRRQTKRGGAKAPPPLSDET